MSNTVLYIGFEIVVIENVHVSLKQVKGSKIEAIHNSVMCHC